MRVNEIGGGPANEDWGFSRPGAQLVWGELGEILKFGCAPQGDQLVLPAMAALIDDPAVSTDHYLAQAGDLKLAPTEASATIGRAAPWELVTVVSPRENRTAGRSCSSTAPKSSPEVKACAALIPSTFSLVDWMVKRAFRIHKRHLMLKLSFRAASLCGR